MWVMGDGTRFALWLLLVLNVFSVFVVCATCTVCLTFAQDTVSFPDGAVLWYLLVVLKGTLLVDVICVGAYWALKVCFYLADWLG